MLYQFIEQCFTSHDSHRVWPFIRDIGTHIDVCRRYRRASAILYKDVVTFRLFLEDIQAMRGALDMSKNSTTKGTSRSRRRGDVDWLSVAIPDDQYDDVAALADDTVALATAWVALAVIVDNMYLKHDPGSDDVSAGMFMTDDDVPGRVCGLSGWSDSVSGAIAALLYKWHVVLDGTLPPPKGDVARRFR